MKGLEGGSVRRDAARWRGSGMFVPRRDAHQSDNYLCRHPMETRHRGVHFFPRASFVGGADRPHAAKDSSMRSSIWSAAFVASTVACDAKTLGVEASIADARADSRGVAATSTSVGAPPERGPRPTVETRMQVINRLPPDDVSCIAMNEARSTTPGARRLPTEVHSAKTEALSTTTEAHVAIREAPSSKTEAHSATSEARSSMTEAHTATSEAQSAKTTPRSVETEAHPVKTEARSPAREARSFTSDARSWEAEPHSCANERHSCTPRARTSLRLARSSGNGLPLVDNGTHCRNGEPRSWPSESRSSSRGHRSPEREAHSANSEIRCCEAAALPPSTLPRSSAHELPYRKSDRRSSRSAFRTFTRGPRSALRRYSIALAIAGFALAQATFAVAMPRLGRGGSALGKAQKRFFLDRDTARERSLDSSSASAISSVARTGRLEHNPSPPRRRPGTGLGDRGEATCAEQPFFAPHFECSQESCSWPEPAAAGAPPVTARRHKTQAHGSTRTVRAPSRRPARAMGAHTTQPWRATQVRTRTPNRAGRGPMSVPRCRGRFFYAASCLDFNFNSNSIGLT